MDDGKLDALGQTIVTALPGAATGHSIAFDRADDPRRRRENRRGRRNICATTRPCASSTSPTSPRSTIPAARERFDVVYHFLSPTLNARVRLKAEADETTQVPSIIDVFPGADWFERETYDLYGVIFTGHPDMRRLLTDYGFEGHPLRKDFPLTGFVEVRYDDQEKRGASTSRCASTRNSASSISCRPGKARTIRCRATRRQDRRPDHERAATEPPQLHHQFRAAASGGPRRVAARAGARRRGGRARRSAYRAAASRHREADRAQDLSAGDPVFRPARLCRADEPGARLLPRGREAPRASRCRAAAN